MKFPALVRRGNLLMPTMMCWFVILPMGGIGAL